MVTMPFEIKYDAEKECVFATFTGKITMALVHEYIDAVLPVLEEHDCKRLLSDSRNAEIQVSALDILSFPKLAAKSLLTARCKRAVLASPGQSGYVMYETLSAIQGHKVRVFPDRDEAMKWLMED
jgi:hypothetical protein